MMTWHLCKITVRHIERGDIAEFFIWERDAIFAASAANIDRHKWALVNCEDA